MNSRKVLFTLSVLIVVVAVLLFKVVVHKSSTVAVTVNVNKKDAQVLMLPMSSYPKVKTSGSGEPGNKKFRLAPGRYIVQAYTKSAYTNKVIRVVSGEKQAFDISLQDPEIPEPVIEGVEDSGVFASSTNLRYLSTSDFIMNVGVDSISRPLAAQRFTNTVWNDSGQGLAREIDGKLDLYSGSMRPVYMPFKNTTNPAIRYDIGPTGIIFITNGQDVYEGDGSVFKKIYSAGNGYITMLSAGSNHVAFDVKSNDRSNKLVVVDTSGQSKQIGVNVKSLAWADDDKYLGVGVPGGAGAIYSANLTGVQVVPNLDITSIDWIGSADLVYVASSAIWHHQLSSNSSSVIANITPTNKVNTLFISTDNSYVYYPVNSTGGAILARTPLKGQKVAESLGSLSAALPEKLGLCGSSYINFTNPVVYINYPGGETTGSLCQSKAKQELEYLGAVPSSLEYRVVPYDSFSY